MPDDQDLSRRNVEVNSGARSNLMRRWFGRENIAAAFVLPFCIALYVFVFGHLSLQRHALFATTTFDLGIYDQSAWLIYRSQPLFLTTRGLHVFGDHFCLVLSLVAALYHISCSPEFLLVVQTVSLALGAIPAYLIAARHVGSRNTAVVFAVAYLAHPALGWMNAFDFHPDALATMPLLWALWAIEARRTKVLLGAVVALLLCKEVMGLLVVMIGIYAVRPMGWRVGLSTIALGAAGLCGSMLAVRYFNGGQSSAYVSLYGQYGSGFGAIALNLATHPVRLFTDLTSQQNLSYLMQMAYPFLFLSALAPRTMLIAVPMLLSNMLSNRQAMHELYFQYNAVTLPIFLVAAVHGFEVMLRWCRNGEAKRLDWLPKVLVIGLSLCIVVAWQHGPISSGAGSHLAPPISVAQAKLIEKAMQLVPAEATVSAQTAIAAHMAHRRFIYMYPNPFRETCWGNSATALEQELGKDLYPEDLAQTLKRIHDRRGWVEYVLLAPGSSDFPIGPCFVPYVKPILLSQDYGVIWAQGDVVVLRRGADHAVGMKMLASEDAACPELTNMVMGTTNRPVRASGADSKARSQIAGTTVKEVPSFRAVPPIVALDRVIPNEDHTVQVELTSFDGRAFRVGDIQAEHIRSWQSTPSSTGHVMLVGKFRTTEQPGEHTDRIVLWTTDPTLPPFEIPVQYTVLGEYQANPTSVNLGMLPSNAVSKVSFAITGPNLSALALDKLPRNLKVHLDRTAPNVCRVTGEYTAREAAKSFVTDSIVLTTGNSRQPRIVVPFYAGTE